MKFASKTLMLKKMPITNIGAHLHAKTRQAARQCYRLCVRSRYEELNR